MAKYYKDWSKSAIKCYRLGFDCARCDIPKIMETPCRMKESVKCLLQNSGRPGESTCHSEPSRAEGEGTPTNDEVVQAESVDPFNARRRLNSESQTSKPNTPQAKQMRKEQKMKENIYDKDLVLFYPSRYKDFIDAVKKGFTKPNDIAKVIGTSANQVRVAFDNFYKYLVKERFLSGEEKTKPDEQKTTRRQEVLDFIEARLIRVHEQEQNAGENENETLNQVENKKRHIPCNLVQVEQSADAQPPCHSEPSRAEGEGESACHSEPSRAEGEGTPTNDEVVQAESVDPFNARRRLNSESHTPQVEQMPKKSRQDLTKTEEKIVELLMEGLDYNAIAKTLVLAKCTVRTHVTNIFKKRHYGSLQDLLVDEYKRKLSSTNFSGGYTGLKHSYLDETEKRINSDLEKATERIKKARVEIRNSEEFKEDLKKLLESIKLLRVIYGER